ncbi:peptide deformylase [Hominifimenecus sp. rT4P-3]|uniref:peptide deformylase n=1 Tax=Hominifimenecus sp. rT4P-3 TaxID=3242979 RepID=UPI003DA4D5EB
MIQPILQLGNPQLYEQSEEVTKEEWAELASLERDLHDTMMEYRRVHHAGRAIAAPQIGVKKRVLYMNVGEPILLVNPRMEFPDLEKMEVMDDCMSFPGLLVRVERYRRCRIHYWDRNGEECVLELEGDLSELLQHEYDHLDGILATMRALDEKSFYVAGNF